MYFFRHFGLGNCFGTKVNTARHIKSSLSMRVRARRSTVLPSPFPYWAYSLADHLIGENGSRQTLVRRVVGHRQELGARGQVDQHPHHLRQVIERNLDVHLDNQNGTGIVFTKGNALILSLL